MIPVLLLLACRPEPSKETADTAEATDEAAGYPNGDYLLGFSIAAVGGLTIPFQANVRSVLDDSGAPLLQSFELRATDGAEDISEVLASVSDLPYGEGGGVELALGAFTLPGAYAPTGGDVALAVTLSVAASDALGFCGDVSGLIVTFGLNLEGSTFGAVPWEHRAEGASTSCQAEVTELPRIDAADCPALSSGTNTDFPSAELSRSFEVALPSAYDAGTSWPLVFVYHGYGGAGSGMLDAGLVAKADELGAILIAPDAADRGGQEAWDVFNDASTNTDLVFFDDLVTCASETWNIDPDRIHATGMSNGGLFTGLLIGQRSDVLASAAPLSGGLMGEMAAGFAPLPVQVLWGGETDEAYEVDFDAAAEELIALLLDEESYVVACEHDEGHSYRSSYWDFTLPFLLDHSRGAEPYGDALPESYPDWCWIAE